LIAIAGTINRVQGVRKVAKPLVCKGFGMHYSKPH